MSNQKEIPGESFESSIQSKELAQLTGDISEAALDSILKDGLLKEVPIIGTMINLFKIGVSLRERHYLKKIYKFLYQLKDISQKDREKFNRDIRAESKSTTDFFEKILYLIDRLDNTEKAEIVGRLFGNLIKEKVKTDDFLRLTSIIDKAYIGDLKYIDFRYGNKKKMRSEESLIYFQSINESLIKDSLVNIGIMIFDEKENTSEQKRYGVHKKMIRTYKLTKMGDILIDYGL